MFLELFSVITMVNAWKTQYIISDWLHTPYQTIFMVIYCIFKISSPFGNYLWNSPVKRGGQPHGRDQCGYIHLLYRSDFSFTVVEVKHLCRLGWYIFWYLKGPKLKNSNLHLKEIFWCFYKWYPWSAVHDKVRIAPDIVSVEVAPNSTYTKNNH